MIKKGTGINMKKISLAILGATGAVGTEMLKVLTERNFPVGSLKMLADKNDAGKIITWQGTDYVVEETTVDSFQGVDILMVAVPNPVSLLFTPEAVKSGAIVIDNSSAYRLEKDVPLVVPEVNPEDVEWHKGIIANPNCSTIIAMVAAYALHQYSPIKRIIASTYQAVSGAGASGIKELETQMGNYIKGEEMKPSAFQHQIACNLIPHIDVVREGGYTKEELKMLFEGRKILHNPDMKVACTCVRVPVVRSHSESLNIETVDKITVEKARELLAGAKGVKLVDDIDNKIYPMPKDTANQDLVFVGRVREDISGNNSLNIWCCGDQIRKGAATNAVQIAELLVEKNLLK